MTRIIIALGLCLSIVLMLTCSAKAQSTRFYDVQQSPDGTVTVTDLNRARTHVFIDQSNQPLYQSSRQVPPLNTQYPNAGNALLKGMMLRQMMQNQR